MQHLELQALKGIEHQKPTDGGLSRNLDKWDEAFGSLLATMHPGSMSAEAHMPKGEVVNNGNEQYLMFMPMAFGDKESLAERKKDKSTEEPAKIDIAMLDGKTKVQTLAA